MKIGFIQFATGGKEKYFESKEELKKTFGNASIVLEPITAWIKKQIVSKEKVAAADFNTPNHYAKLMYEAGKRDAYNEIIELLSPDEVD